MPQTSFEIGPTGYRWERFAANDKKKHGEIREKQVIYMVTDKPGTKQSLAHYLTTHQYSK